MQLSLYCLAFQESSVQDSGLRLRVARNTRNTKSLPHLEGHDDVRIKEEKEGPLIRTLNKDP